MLPSSHVPFAYRANFPKFTGYHQALLPYSYSPRPQYQQIEFYDESHMCSWGPTRLQLRV